MNYVGQLAETVFVTVKELYRGLNPATLTGAIDVIVVRQPDGSLQCSPFHVRFGKLGVLRSKEKVVDMEVNGEPVQLQMKLGDNGEAFFVEENEDFESRVPAHLCTSPIHMELLGEAEEPLEQPVSSGSMRRKKRRRKRIRSESHRREDGSSSSDEREREKEQAGEQGSLSLHSLFSVFYSRPSSPKSDSELLMKPQDSLGPQMQWSWGGFPKVRPNVSTSYRIYVLSYRPERGTLEVQRGVRPSVGSHFRTIQRQDSFDMGLEPGVNSSMTVVVRPKPRIAVAQPTESSLIDLEGTTDVSHSTPIHPTSDPSTLASIAVASFLCCVIPGKRSQHLGPSDIYLDDLSNLNPEVAALYFPPKNETEVGLRLDAELGPGSGNQTPQSVGSGAVDSGMEYLSDSASDHMDVSMSLCGGTGHTSQINRDKFLEHLVKYQDLVSNPGIIEDPNLVICINSKYYNWAVAAPMVLSMQVFQKSLPKSTIDQLVKVKMPKKSGRWWFWRRKDMDTNHIQVADRHSRTILTMRLCCGQERLNLREGANTVMFSVTTQYQGTCRCEAAIYLWNWNDRVVISDIDGTITKSDALGHILPQLGKDWTHHGIARLYHKIHQNGYKFLYCSARAIGMADITKGYLQWVNDKGTVLPKGPVLLAPSSFFSALHREVVEKKPEVFKIACLTDIRDLFNPQRQPFYAAFGNRTNDAYAYKEVGVPDTKIFTVNPKGELVQEKNKGTKSSYTHLGELVEHFFPMISQDGWSSSFDCPEYSHFSYWREPLPPLDLSALN
uniref:phosphatidate phosphatase n=1 Tax=Esox lucius TaxID=8010 RepID=A0A6Q2X350_ESOLU